jgi:serine/threonine protein kinase
MASGLERLDPPRSLGRMQLLAQLGEGGMATVYLATVGQGMLVRPAAVKLLRAEAPDHDYRTRFLDEARLVVRLHHNNLVDVREAGDIDGQLFIAMEMVEGRDLADVWDRGAELGRAIPVPVAVYVAREVLRGLHYAHTAPGLGLVHRDVSPSNILIDWAGAVRLADFGLATSTLKATTTVPGIVFGKVGYMSPEQARHKPLDGRADVYGCGVVLWELLTGRPMRDSGADTNTVARAEPRAPSLLSHRVDAQLDGIILKALARSRDDRYPSAQALQEALTAWLTTNAPGTGQDTLAGFMLELFGDVHDQERALLRNLLEQSAGPGRTLIFTSEAMDAATSGASAFSPAVEEAPGSVSAAFEAAEESEHIEAGTLIDERYRVLSRLGQGGMGTVYLGEHLTVGRSVGIKVLTRAWSANPGVAQRFRAEARAASAAGHPNIVEVFDAGELDDGRLYLVMEFLTGKSLYEDIRDDGTMEVARACRMLRQIGRAIRAAHGVGVIHRDLKPENVMVVDRGEGESIKVLDFGVSAQTDVSGERMTSAGQALGTPEYMAPEQARGEVPTPSIDIYAIGVLAFEMLTGDPPFVGTAAYEVLARKTSEAAPSLGSLREGLPPDLVGLIDDCLAIDPGDRPSTVDAFLDRLDEVLRNLPRGGAGQPRVAPAAVTAEAPAAESRAPWVVGAMVTLGAALAAGVALLPADEAAPQGPEAAVVTTPDSTAVAGKQEAPSPTPAPAPEADVPPAEVAPAEIPVAPAAPAGTAADPEPKPEPAIQAPDTPQPAPVASDRCPRRRQLAREAHQNRNWEGLLRHTGKRACFPDRAELVRFRVQALRQTLKLEACIKEGAGFSDPQVRKGVAWCQRRLDRG